MDLTVLEANKNIMLSAYFGGTAASSFTQQLYVPFTPDYMIVRGVNYRADGTNDVPGAYSIYSDLISDNIGSFQISEVAESHVPAPIVAAIPYSIYLIYKLNKPVQGTFTFNLNHASGTNHNLNGELLVHIEFIKLKSEKPQKIF